MNKILVSCIDFDIISMLLYIVILESFRNFPCTSLTLKLLMIETCFQVKKMIDWRLDFGYVIFKLILK